MKTISDILIIVLIGGGMFAINLLIDYFSRLNRRVNQLEKQSEKGSDFAIKLVNRLIASSLRPNAQELEGIQANDACDALDRVKWHIGNRLFNEIPGLRRVVSFSIGVSLDFLREKTGVTLEELKDVDRQLLPELPALAPSLIIDPSTGQPFSVVSPDPVRSRYLWVGNSIVIEEWSTHIVVMDSGKRNVIYAKNLGDFRWHPLVLWSRRVPEKLTYHPAEGCYFSVDDGDLEVALYDNSIWFWARRGRFHFGGFDGNARREHCLVQIPLEEKMLEEFRFPPIEPDSDGLDDEDLAQEDWIHNYGHRESDENPAFIWQLTVRDIAKYAIESYK
jgi:hypothetical protein